MKPLQIIAGLLAIFLILPISIYLQYQILTRVSATEVMWLLFWIQWPAIVLMQIITQLVKAIES